MRDQESFVYLFMLELHY